MAKRAASNASARCGALTTAITELSPSASVPIRWIKHDATGVWPAMTQFHFDRLEPRHHLFVVGLVRQGLDVVAQHTVLRRAHGRGPCR